jgi:hypothetical protein
MECGQVTTEWTVVGLNVVAREGAYQPHTTPELYCSPAGILYLKGLRKGWDANRLIAKEKLLDGNHDAGLSSCRGDTPQHRQL